MPQSNALTLNDALLIGAETLEAHCGEPDPTCIQCRAAALLRAALSQPSPAVPVFTYRGNSPEEVLALLDALDGYTYGTSFYAGAAPQPTAAVPDGRLHADGYFTWATHHQPWYGLDRGLPRDFYLTAPQLTKPSPAVPSGREVLRQAFELCEDTEKRELQDLEFNRGRKFEAKQIRKALGTWHWDASHASPQPTEPAQPATQAGAGRFSFNCTNGCGECSVRMTEFVTHSTQAQEGDPWVTVDSVPHIVSACCGADVEVFDERAQDTVAKVKATPTPQPSQDAHPQALAMTLADLSSILACEIECGVYEKHVAPVLERMAAQAQGGAS